MATQHIRAHSKDGNGASKNISFHSQDNDVSITSSNQTLPSGTTTLRGLIDSLGALAFEDEIELDVASTEAYGVTQLSNVINDQTEEGKAATTKAVSEVNNAAVHNTGNEDIAGVKNFSTGSIQLGGLEISYDAANDQLDIMKVTASS